MASYHYVIALASEHKNTGPNQHSKQLQPTPITQFPTAIPMNIYIGFRNHDQQRPRGGCYAGPQGLPVTRWSEGRYI